MNLKEKIKSILDDIQKTRSQINFDSSQAREDIAAILARNLEKKSNRTQKYQSDAGSLIF